MRIHRLSQQLHMIEVDPPIAGWDECIGLYVLGGDQMALIDVGPRSTAGDLIDGMKALDVEPESVKYVFLTHIHLDHAGAIGQVLEYLPEARAVVHPKGAPHLVDTGTLWAKSCAALGKLARSWGEPASIARERVLPAEDGMRYSLGNGLEVEAIHTPGHAAHHMSFLEHSTGMLFAGEAAGVYNGEADLLRPATPSPLRLEQKLASIAKLADRSLTGICYAHFGPGGDGHSSLLRSGQQLRMWQALIGQAVDGGGQPEAIFSQLVNRDPNLKGLTGLPEGQYERECYFIRRSVEGFVEYIRRQEGHQEPHCMA